MQKSLWIHEPLQASSRRGVSAVIVAILLVVLFAFTAFCVDIGWTTLTKSHLQNAADSAAAAGARQLVDNYAAYSIPLSQQRAALIAASRDLATEISAQYGAYHRAGDAPQLTVRPEDIILGFTNAAGVFESLETYSGYPNTVKVITRRDNGSNGRLPFFFAPVIGVNDTSVTATASATIYTGLITSFDPDLVSGSGNNSGGSGSGGNGGSNGHGNGNGSGNASGGTGGLGSGGGGSSSSSGLGCSLLPIAFDVHAWTRFLNDGRSPDGQVHPGTNGIPQIQVYPSPQNSPGNFGLLCIGPDTNAVPDFRDWILDGPTANDLQWLIETNKLPVALNQPRPWKGTPGLRNTLRSDFEDIIGQPRMLPLFEPIQLSPSYQAAGGQGSNTFYNIVGFVGVKVTSVTGNGSNLNITVQPCDIVDPTAVFDPLTVFPVGAEPPSQMRTFTHVSTRFTR